jgi:hypothetical protein
MTPIEVLKMLKSKIDASGLNKCNYAIKTSDIEAINQALLLPAVIKSVCGWCGENRILNENGSCKCCACLDDEQTVA